MPEVVSYGPEGGRRRVTRDHGSQVLARKIVEDAIGRRLKGYEIVHHIDEDTSNDALTNLAIVSRSMHNRLHRDRARAVLFPPASVADMLKHKK